jgi:hypothetical protein
MKSAVLFLILTCATSAAAQSPVPETDTQSWNDFQFTIPMTKKIDFVPQLTLRFRDNLTQPVDERWGFGWVYKVNEYLSLGTLYFHREARPPNGRREHEDRITVGATLQKPFGKFTVSDRNWLEHRWREPQVDAWRYRNRLRVEHPFTIGKEKFNWFVSDEVFYDWSLHVWPRNRASAGLNRAINKHLTLELYYLRQNDGRSRPGDLHIIGTLWRFKL